jgi:hypothetical protein
LEIFLIIFIFAFNHLTQIHSIPTWLDHSSIPHTSFQSLPYFFAYIPNFPSPRKSSGIVCYFYDTPCIKIRILRCWILWTSSTRQHLSIYSFLIIPSIVLVYISALFGWARYASEMMLMFVYAHITDISVLNWINL